MEIAYIKEFVKLVQYGSYQEAAEVMYLSTSALSKHIKKLEDELSIELFTDNKNRLTLTPIGRTFLSYALELTEKEAECMAAITEMKRNQQEVIIGYSRDALMYPSIMARITNAFPSKVRMIESDNTSILEKIYMNRIDYAALCELERDDLPRDRFQRLCLTRDEIVLVVPSALYPDREGPISVKDFEEKNFINFGFPSALGEFESVICRDNSIMPNFKRLNTSRLFFLMIGIMKNRDVALLPRSVIEKFVRETPDCKSQLSWYSLENPYYFSVNLVYMRDKLNLLPALEEVPRQL